MLTEDIVEVKKNKKKYKMGYSPETLSYPHKVKDIYEADTKADTKADKAKPPKKVHRDPMYQRMINYARAQYPYVKNEEDAITRLVQDRLFHDHERNDEQTKDIKNLKKDIADLQDELHDLKRTLKKDDHGKTVHSR